MRIAQFFPALSALLTLAALAMPTAYAQAKSADAAKITIYHIEGTRGERIVWLCEELGIPYNLDFKPGNPAASMQQIRAVNPLMPMSPTVGIDGAIVVESGAIIELLLARQGKGRLAPAVDSPDFPYYLQWMHFAEGSLAARVIADYRVAQVQGANAQGTARRGVSGSDTLKFADTFLANHPFFGGQEFSAADIMMLFPMTYAERIKMATLSDYPNIVAWQKRVEERPAFQRMVKVARSNPR
jgi:glutathione S-transferase